MYIVTIYNEGIPTEIHNETEKLKSGNVVKGINAIDSFSFVMLPSNPGFNLLREKKTLVEVYNTSRNRYEFFGRVLFNNPSMSEDGKIQQEVTCESFLGFLCDSEQVYIEPKNWTVAELLQFIIDEHNSQLEEYKHFAIGEVTVTDLNDNLFCGIQRKNTFETIKEKLLDVLGGELRIRVVDGVTYLDYLSEIGGRRSTAIELSRNMKAITKEKDPSEFVSRLRPLGCKLTREETTTDEDGNETTQTVELEQRLDITSVNDGLDYILDEAAEAEYGICVRSVEWDDVTNPGNLKSKGEAWLAENNKVQVKYSITAIDLSLLGLDIDDFDVGNWHPIKNDLLGIDDEARIIKKNIDVCEEVKSTIEVGENFKTLSDILAEQSKISNEALKTVTKIESDYVTNQALTNESRLLYSLIKQTERNIKLEVSETYYSKSVGEELEKTVSSGFELVPGQIKGEVSTVTEKYTEEDGKLQSQLDTIKKYFTFDVNGLTIGEINNPNKVIINNDKISIMVNGVAVQSFDANGKALIPELTVTNVLTLLGLEIEEDDTHINCSYLGV